MRRIIARFPCDLTGSGVLEAMRGITPELATNESVITDRRPYPVKQAGDVRTRQDCRDFSTAQVIRTMSACMDPCEAQVIPKLRARVRFSSPASTVKAQVRGSVPLPGPLCCCRHW
ncbi:SCO5918 family protein [Streptomyces sp. MP131-18]|uniref:SCO5918 family protein n=1 Tax=Streptomyces sp. MP131-18 TaxID=1857892 RepID=UPI00097BB7A4|nr:SCO5918 family protein [Streptomyces sp. MP131-18]